MNSFLFSGYARLPQDVSHQALYSRVGVVVEVDQNGRIIHCSCTLIMDLARDFLNRLLSGRSVISERDVIESELRYRYRGHSQSALIYALRKVFEAVDQSPLVIGAAVDGAEGRTSAASQGPEKAGRRAPA
jgi:hypothetical protein